MNYFKDLFDLSGEIAIVTGGASGIGKGISQGETVLRAFLTFKKEVKGIGYFT